MATTAAVIEDRGSGNNARKCRFRYTNLTARVTMDQFPVWLAPGDDAQARANDRIPRAEAFWKQQEIDAGVSAAKAAEPLPTLYFATTNDIRAALNAESEKAAEDATEAVAEKKEADDAEARLP